MAGPTRKPSKKEGGYIRKEVSECTKIPARTIQYYTDRGLLIPDVAPTKGRGTTRRYSRKNMFELLVIKELVRHGIKLERVKWIMEYIRRLMGEHGEWNLEYDVPVDHRMCLILTNIYMEEDWRPDIPGSYDHPEVALVYITEKLIFNLEEFEHQSILIIDLRVIVQALLVIWFDEAELAGWRKYLFNPKVPVKKHEVLKF